MEKLRRCGQGWRCCRVGSVGGADGVSVNSVVCANSVVGVNNVGVSGGIGVRGRVIGVVGFVGGIGVRGRVIGVVCCGVLWCVIVC